jgi:RHS repeat-associated protein
MTPRAIARDPRSASRRSRHGRQNAKHRTDKSFLPALLHLEQRVVLSTDFWTGHSASTGGNDNWSNQGNWSLNAVPGPADIADFTGAQSQSSAAVVDTAESVGQVQIDPTWNGLLTVNNPLTVSGNYAQASSTVNGTSTISAAGSASAYSGGNLDVSFSNSGTMIWSGTNDLHIAGTFTNTGTVIDNGAQLIRTDANNTTINNQAGAFFDFQAAANLYVNGNTGCVFNNAGTLEDTLGSGTAQTSYVVNNLTTGLITSTSVGTLALTGGGSGAGNDQVTISNSGSVSLGGNFSGTISGSGSGSGAIFVGNSSNFIGSGVTLNFTGSVLQFNTATMAGLVTNAGNMAWTGTNDLHISGTLTNTGAIIVSGTMLIRTDANNTTINNQSGASFDFQAPSNLFVNGTTNDVFNNAGTLERTAGTSTATTSYVVNNSGTIAGNAGTLQLTGGGSGSGTDSVTDSGGGSVSLGGSFNGTIAGSGSGAGGVLLGNNTAAFTGGGAGVSLNFSGGALQFNSATMNGLVTNAGTMTWTGTNDLHIAGTLTNTGTIIVSGAMLIRTDSNNTTINNQAGAFFDFQAPANLFMNGTTSDVFNNAGTLERTAGTGTATTSYLVNNSGTIAGNSGTLQFTGGGSGSGTDTVTDSGGGSVSLGGNFTGTMAGSGSGAGGVFLGNAGTNFVGTGAGITLNLTGAALQLNAGAIGGLITNAGTMSWTGTNDIHVSGTLTNTGTIVVSGNMLIRTDASNTTINNQAGAFFDFQAAANLFTNGTTNDVFNNVGTLERTAGTGTATTSYVVNNSGTIAGNSGTLQITGGGSGSGTDTVTASGGGSVSLGGNFTGTIAGSGLGGVFLGNGGANFVGTGAGVTLNLTGNALQLNSGTIGGLITNAGNMTWTGTNDVHISGTLTNTGTINVAAGMLIRADLANTTINNQPGAVFNFQAAANLYANGQTNPIFNNAGTLEMTAPTGTAQTSFGVNNTGTIACTSGTLKLTGGGSGSGNDVISPSAGATVYLTGSFGGTFAGAGAATGTVQIASLTGSGSGATFDFFGSVLQVVGDLSGTITNSGTMALAPGGELRLNGTLNNTGTIVATSNNEILANANGVTINNAAGATFELQSFVTLPIAPGDSAAFNNSGTIEVSAAANVPSEIAFPMAGSGNIVITSGTFQADAGTLQFDSSNSAALSISPSASLNVGGNLAGSTQNSGIFAPAGSVLFDGSGTAMAPQTLEAMSQDLGNVAAGFHKNFAYGTISLSNNTYLQLVDNSQNIAGGGSKANAVYVNSLNVPSGSTLDLHGLHLYARQNQINGTVTGGTVSTLPTGGLLALNAPVPGNISSASQVDDWTFYGQAGQTVAVVVDTGSSGLISPSQPTLNFAQVQVVDPNGNVVASGTNINSGADVALSGISLTTNGIYHVKVQAPSQSGATGNYILTEWDANTHTNFLNLNQTQNGVLNSPFTADQWSFSAPANEPVQFNLLQVSSPAVRFSLTGPNGVTLFTNQSTSSGQISLPAAGTYTLTAQLASDQPGAYAFNISVSGQTNLTIGTPFQGTLSGNGQSQLFAVTTANPAALSITLTDTNAQDQNEVYVYAGQAPTQVAYQFKSTGVGANQTVAFAAQPATYYILVYNSVVNTPGSHYTLTVQAPPFAWTGFTPGEVGRDELATFIVTGIFPNQFQSKTAYQIEFIASDNTVYPSTPLYLTPTDLGRHPLVQGQLPGPITPPSLSATLLSNTLPAGTYSVKIIDSLGNSQTMPGALKANTGGFGFLSPKLVVPNPVGYHQPTTLYVQYTNTGNAPMAAPLLVLTATQKGQQGAFLSLDPNVAGLGYQSDTTPQGFSQSVQFVANGAIPGILEPGETVTVPIYDGGWLHTQWDFSRPPIIFSLGELDATNSVAIDWSSLEAGMKPSSMSPAAWNAIFPTLTANLGSTWGQYLQTLDNDAFYLASIGEPTNDLNNLLSFEIEKADAELPSQTLATVLADALPAPGLPLTFQQSFQQSINGRYTQGVLGFGWTTNWDIAATTLSNGDVTIENDGTSAYYSLQPGGSFAPQPGAEGSSLTASGGAYRLVGVNSTIIQFNANGTLNYVQDTHGNRITAAYNAQNQLGSLTHSNGESLSLTYNAQGHLAKLTDSDGVAETYGYDATGQFLTSYTDEYGTTTYTYVSGQSAAQNNALAQIAYADNTHLFFGYDSQGRLIDQHRDNNQNDVSFGYISPGGYTTTDANGNTTTTDFDSNGKTAEAIDALGNITRFGYDSNLNLVSVVGPGGVSESATYDANGNLTSETDPLGHTTAFTHDGNNNLTSYTDAKGNSTSYAYNAQNDLLSITYANGTKQQATYNPLGEATQYINANGQAATATYNSQGLVATEAFADGSSFIYTNDARGNLLSAQTSAGTTNFSYTNVANPDLLTKVTYPDGTFLSFSYSVVGKRTQSVDQTGFTVNYTYDSAGRLSKLTDSGGKLIVQYTYDGAGQLIQKDMGNGTRSVYTYDAVGNLHTATNYAAAGGAINSSDTYTYDALGNMLTETNQDGEWVYTYDAASQMLSAVFTPNNANPDQLQAQNLQYAYDAVGNRVSQTVNGVQTTYTVNNVNEYTSSATAGATTSYQYDAEGNLVSQSDPTGTTHYTFNSIDQLTAVTGPGLTASYTYDALGGRNSQTINGVSTNFELDPMLGDEMTASLGAGGAVSAHYTFGFGLVSQVSAGGTSSYYDFNNLGSTVGITGANGTYTDKYAYLPFGQTVMATAPLANPFTFVGQFGATNDGSGTIMMGLRQFNPSTGQFLSSDPIGLAGGTPNIREYANNEPTNLIDPSGTNWFSTLWSAKKARDSYKDATTENSGAEQFTNGVANRYGSTNDVINNDNFFNNGPINGPGGYGQSLDQNQQANQQIADNAGKFEKELSKQINYSSRPSKPSSLIKPLRLLYDILRGSGLLKKRGATAPTPPGNADGSTTSSGSTSGDPNEMIGPAGFGTSNFVVAGALLPYKVEFENEATATAPAQRVDVTDQLDPNLDWTTLQLTSVSFGSNFIIIPAGLQHYETTVPIIENGQAINVRIDLNLNAATGVLSASFQSIDPTTGLPPANLLTGFLPPEDGSGRGIGFFTFTINPKTGLATGTQIRNVADVSFDQAQIISTDQVNDEDPSQGIDPNKQALVTIDATPPTSTVATLPAHTNTTSFTVNWSGSDGAGPGIAGFNVFVSDNGGPFTAFQTNTTATSAQFTGQFGHTYGFYSVATDNAGLAQPTPSAAQATTYLVALPTSSVSALPAVTLTPSFTVSWSGTPGQGAASIASFSVFVSDNGGAFTAFKTATTSTSATFNGQAGHTYGFYSVATDNLGDVQTTPTSAQATTLVAGPPASTVSSLPATTTNTSFTVSWSGTPGAGATSIASFSVFVSQDGGTFTPFQTATTGTSASFSGALGHKYGFYSVATNNLGLVQPTPSAAQVTTTIAGLPTSTVSALPATTRTPGFTVSWSGTPGAGASSITSYSVFVSDNGGTFSSFKTATTATSATFTGQRGHTYGFYSVATDNLGDTQTTPASAQASTTIAKTLTAGDFNGDGKTDTAIYDQTKSQFFVLLSGGAGALTPQFGNPKDTNIPIAGDFDGDGKADTAIYDQTRSQFFILLSGGGALTPQFGNPKDVNIPISGDFDGDGKSDIGIYDQTQSKFFILLSGGGALTPQFGNPKDVNIPVTGDFDGDGKTDIGIYDQTKSQYFILLSGGGALTPQFGNPNDGNIPIAGDFNGDGKTDIGVYDQTKSQFIISLSGGGGMLTPQFGNPKDVNIPVSGDFDGDGKTDTGIYDQTRSQFFILLSGGGALTPQFGNPAHTNVPIPSVYAPRTRAATDVFTRSDASGFAAADFAASAAMLASRSAVTWAPPMASATPFLGSSTATSGKTSSKHELGSRSLRPAQAISSIDAWGSSEVRRFHLSPSGARAPKRG